MDDTDLPLTSGSASITLVVRRKICARPEALFAAWTQPAHLKKWWGPRPVTCVDAEVDLRVGGGYRIANQFPDGTLLWIVGEFEVVDPPHKLVYTWRAGFEPRASERVTVQFDWQGDATEVTVVHEGIPNAAIRNRHESGWNGCLDGLANYLNPEASK
jgi:uncharacterized protein YndB with AHSA1/START domain